jgi:ATP-binding cassette subfamily B protein
VWAAAHFWTVAWVTLAVLEGVLPIATVYLTRALINALVSAVKSSGTSGDMRHVLAVGALMACVLLGSRIFRSLKTWVSEIQAGLLREHITGLIHAKSAEADLQFYDSPEFYDHLHRARDEARYRPVLLVENLGTLLQNSITLLAMIGILAGYGPLLALALVVSTVPALYLVVRSSEARHALARAATADERRSGYFDWLLTSADGAQELRLFHLAPLFQQTFQAIRRDLRSRQVQLVRRQVILEVVAGSVSLVVASAALLLMLWRAIRGLLSLGDLALFYQAFNQGLSLSQGILGSVGQLYENTLFLGNLFEFLDFKSQVTPPTQPKTVPKQVSRSISFRNVCFRYPGTDKPVLQNLTLSIPAGNVVSIVGPNGSGKSTILKLLCRFYDPQSGVVELDGIPLHEFSPEELRDSISALFQAPVHYNSTVADNIGYGNLSSSLEEEIRAAAEQSGAAPIVDNLPNRYGTPLGRWFWNGSELSVGEWQRLALARALYRRAPILVLDEPTSSMDPWAELEWAKNLREIAAGRTAIVITHRFTTAMFTDRIVVLDAGQVREEGTHQELLDRRGLYASGWALSHANR